MISKKDNTYNTDNLPYIRALGVVNVYFYPIKGVK